MPYPNRYIKRENGALVDGIPATTSAGPATSGQLVATGPLGILDVSLLPSGLAGGVTSLNTLTGAITLAGGSGVTLTTSGNLITINASGGGTLSASGDVISSGGLAVVVGFDGIALSVSGALVDGMTWEYNATTNKWVPIFDRATRPASAVAGKPGAGQNVMIYTAECTQTYPANFSTPNSYGSCPAGGYPTATATYSIYKNAALVGNISISTAGVFTFSTVGGVGFTLNAGDRLTIVAPGTQDATLSDVGITLVGTRGSVSSVLGSAPPVITWRGAYNSGTSYGTYDAVSYNGSSYICILPTVGNVPTNTTYWTLIALKGNDGSSSAVQSVNSITGAIIISGGLNVWTQNIGQTVLINASGGSSGNPGPINTISGCARWWDAGQIVGLSDGNSVLFWNDVVQGADAYSMTTAPVYKTNIINGLPVVRFGGVGYFRATMPIDSPAFSYFMVLKMTSLSNAYTGIIGTTWLTDIGGVFVKSNGKTAMYLSTNQSGGGAVYDGSGSATLGTSTFVIISGVVGPTTYSTRVALASDSSGSYTPANLVGGFVTIGSQVNSFTGRALTGDVAEMIIYRKACSTTEVTSIENYLKAKYGL